MKTKDQKRQEAEARQAASDLLIPEQRIAKLDAAFGKGQGAAKERAKLLKLLTVETGQETTPSSVKKGRKPKAA